MNSQSKKMAKTNREYSKLRIEFLTDRPNCMASLPGCTLRAAEIHHKKGRGKYHNDITTWLSVCRVCHDWIETHPEEAIELNLSITRN
tara:strand:+ start:3821 stop:4084 length:264 start_codon:yes stop_codon:yes gene_type:complete